MLRYVKSNLAAGSCSPNLHFCWKDRLSTARKYKILSSLLTKTAESLTAGKINVVLETP